MAEAVAALGSGAPASGAGGWGQAVRVGVIAGLDAVIRDLTVYRGQVLLAHREDGGWGTGQDRDFADWRSRTTGGGRGAATGELVVAEGMAQIRALGEAVARGELGLEHAKALARVRQGASGPVKEALSGEVGAELVEKGKGLSAPDLAKEARKVAAQIDAAAAQADFEAVWQRRSVTTRRSGGAATGQWVLDPVSGTVVATALDAIVGVPGKEDTRTREQRLADALVTMASRVLQVGADLNGAQVRPHLAVVVQEETWAATTAHRRAQEAADRGAAFGLTNPDNHEDDDTGCVGVRPALRPVVGLPDVAPAELEDGTVVPLGELGRLLCDCEATRVVLDAASVVLDVGQTQRTYTAELRRAVTTRDRRCRWPGCTMRASWCEVHHVRWWSHGGVTSVANGMTLCSFHHHVLHAQHVLVVPAGEGFAFYHRDGHLIGTSPHPPRGPRSTRRAPVADGYTPDLTGTRQHLTDPLNRGGRAPDPPTRVDGRPGLAPGGPGGLPDASRGQPGVQGTTLPTTSPGPGGRTGPDTRDPGTATPPGTGPAGQHPARPRQAGTSAAPMLWDDPTVT
ncbi:HNH endonuclease signature motif containing protein [Georgenia sp. TF02-10]|uniref:HNH endonuclease signature motif containing protein n=1 Tax=Georgenia sp. TF02-10 TaxID=2917725 RepID=UPI002738CB62|nr:HNH endonuclease signature motif containing protein [Georgenia sp. TF02-10]